MGGRDKADNIRRLAEFFIIVIDFSDDQFALFIEILKQEIEDNYRYIAYKTIERLIRIREQGAR